MVLELGIPALRHRTLTSVMAPSTISSVMCRRFFSGVAMSGMSSVGGTWPLLHASCRDAELQYHQNVNKLETVYYEAQTAASGPHDRARSLCSPPLLRAVAIADFLAREHSLVPQSKSPTKVCSGEGKRALRHSAWPLSPRENTSGIIHRNCNFERQPPAVTEARTIFRIDSTFEFT